MSRLPQKTSAVYGVPVSSRTKHRLLYHLVFIPKYRKRVLSGEVAKKLTHLFYEVCKVVHCLSVSKTGKVELVLRLGIDTPFSKLVCIYPSRFWTRLLRIITH
jgi:hypothetical protein